MANFCSVCKNEHREEIDKALIANQPARAIARQYNLGKDAVLRHRNAHLPQALALSKHAADVAHGDELIAQMADLNERTEKILHAAEKAKDGKLALKAIAEVRRNLELEGKLLGELSGGKPKAPPKNSGANPYLKHLEQMTPEARAQFLAQYLSSDDDYEVRPKVH